MSSAPDIGKFVRQLEEQLIPDPPGLPPPPAPPIDPSGRGGDDGGMEERLRALETDVAVIKSNYSTKEDVRGLQALMAGLESSLHKELHAQTWKLIGVATGLVAIAFFVGRFVLPAAAHP